MDQLKQYIEENKQRFLDELFELIRIPSVSAKPENKPDMLRMAGALKDNLLAAGADDGPYLRALRCTASGTAGSLEITTL
jgi:acetylornithine deacetylase/succinyl-diaminopimelate desuccinylase-like protein